MNIYSIYPGAALKRTLEEWEILAQQGKADLAALTRDEVEHCRGFCWTCVKRWCP